jgi:hypothetical protein
MVYYGALVGAVDDHRTAPGRLARVRRAATRRPRDVRTADSRGVFGSSLRDLGLIPAGRTTTGSDICQCR